MSGLGDVVDARWWDGYLRDAETAMHFTDPQPGDRFHEVFSHWVYVVEVTDRGRVVTHEFGAHPSAYRAGAAHYTREVYFSRESFARYHRYGTRPGYWMTYCDSAGPRADVRPGTGAS